MKKAYSYQRFSSKKQASGDSLRRQSERAKSWCDRNGFVLDESLTYRDLGVSAYRGKNFKEGAFSVFLDGVAEGTIPKGSCLIVENLDRLSRAEVLEAVGVVGKILQSGIEIVTLDPERRLTKKEANDFDIMFVVMDLMRSHRESAVKSDRSNAVWERKRKQREKLGNAGPAWLEWKDGKFHVIKQKAATVKAIFKFAAQGLGLHQIVRKLHSEKFSNIGRGKKGWNTSYLSIILRGRAVLGEYQPHRMVNGKRVIEGEPLEGYFPAIIDTATFYQVQAALDGRQNTGFRGRGSRLVSNLFQGLLKDARDGGTLCFHKGRSHDSTKDWRFIASYNALRHLNKTPLVTFPYDVLETEILLRLNALSHADFFPTKRKDVKPDIEKKRGDLLDVKGKIKRLHDKIVGGADMDTYMPLLERLQTKKTETEGEIETLMAQSFGHDDRQFSDMQDAIEQLEAVSEAMITMKRSKGDELHEIRTRLQGRLRSMIEGIEVLLSKNQTAQRVHGYQWEKYAFVEIRFKNSADWQMMISYIGSEPAVIWEGSTKPLAELILKIDVTDPVAMITIPTKRSIPK